MTKIRLLFLLMLTGISSAYIHARDKSVLEKLSTYPEKPTIGIRLYDALEGALVEVKGPFNSYDPHTGKKLETAFKGCSYYMFPTNDGIRWGQQFPGIYQISIIPDRKDTTVLVAGKEYKGIIYVYQFDGTFGVVNEISCEDYLKSVLACYAQDAVKKREAIAALIIGLRSDIFHKSLNGSSKYWDIQASESNYLGELETLDNDVMNEVLHTTKHMVLAQSEDKENFISFGTDWIKDGGITVPFEKIETEAEKGHTAKEILETLFPNKHIVLTSEVSKK